MLPALAPSIGVPTITTGTDLIPYSVDSQGNEGTIETAPEKMSPMDSLKAIFEDIRDGINELVVLTREAMPNARDMGISAADVGETPAPPTNDSQGNKFNFPEVPEVGPKLGLALMLGGLVALFEFSDEIAKAIEPVLEIASKVVDAVGVKGLLYSGLAAVAAIKFGPAVLTLITKGIPAAFTTLAGAFTTMKTFILTTAPTAIKGAFGFGTTLFTKAFTALKGAFTAMQLFLTKTLVPTLTTAFAPLSAALLPVTLAIAAAVAIFVSIKAGIDEFKASLEQGDSLLVAITEGVSTALLTLVTLPIVLMQKAAAFIAEKLGFENVAQKLRDLDIVDFIKDSVKNLVIKAKDFVIGLFNIDFNEVLGKFIDIGKSIGTVLSAIAKGSIAAIKAAFPGGESPMEAFKRVYSEVSAGGEGTMPKEAEAAIEDVNTKTDQELKQEQVALENELAESTTSQLSGTMTQADFIMQQEIVSALEKINRELDERARIAAENAAFNNIITTTDNSTTVSSNQLNVGDYAIDGSDATAKSLAAMGYGN